MTNTDLHMLNNELHEEMKLVWKFSKYYSLNRQFSPKQGLPIFQKISSVDCSIKRTFPL